MLSPIPYPLNQASTQVFAKPKRLTLPAISLDEERKGSKQNALLEEENEDSPIRYNPSEAFQTSFANQSLQDSLGLTDLPTPPKTNTPHFTSRRIETENESLPDEMMLDTVRKRQANLPITTHDVFEDFKKTATLLGVDASFDDLLESHFTLINQEVKQAVPDEKWIKTLLIRLAKHLDAKVSTTLEESSNVVGEWLDALFTQPIQWTPLTQSKLSQKSFTSTEESTRFQDLSQASNPLKNLKRVHHLVMKDALERVYTAIQGKKWEIAENIVSDVFSQLPSDAMTPTQIQQWKGLQFKVWQKQGKSERILSEASKLKAEDQNPELRRMKANAYAQSGDFKEAIRTLHPLVAMPTDTEKLEAKTALTSWELLSSWAKALENPALEDKMLQGYYKASKADLAAADISLETMKRLQVLSQLMGRDSQALKLAQERVSLAKAQRNKTAYKAALNDVASVYLNQGDTDKAQKVLALLS